MASDETIASLLVALGVQSDKSSFKEGESLIDHLKGAVIGLVGVETLKGFFELIENTTEAAVATDHLAQRLGTTTDVVQELGYAADISGASVGDMQVALQHLARESENAKKGTGNLAGALSQIHVSLKAGEGVDSQLAAIADGFKNAGPEVNKTALAMELFGRSGTTLIPLLNRGASGIAELRAEFKGLGAELSGNDIEAFKKLEEEQKRVKYLWDGIKLDAVRAILPVVQDLVKSLFDWVKANRELISKTLTNVIDGLVFAIKALAIPLGIVVDLFNLLADVIGGIRDAVMAVVDTFKDLWQGMEDGSGTATLGFIGLTTVVGGLGVALLAAFGPALAEMLTTAALNMLGLVGTIWEAVAATAAWTMELLLNPMTWIVLGIVAAVALVTAGVIMLIKHWNEVTDAVKAVWKGVENFFSNVVDGIKGAWDALMKYLSDAWSSFEKNHPWIAKGIHVGVDFVKGAAGVLGGSAATDAAKNVLSPNDKSVSSGGDTHETHVTNQVAIEVHPGPGMDESKLAAHIGDIFDDKMTNLVRTNYAGTGVG